jgi:hypothetical protein
MVGRDASIGASGRAETLESLARNDCSAQAAYGIKRGALPQTRPDAGSPLDRKMAAVVAATKRKTGRFSLFF